VSFSLISKSSLHSHFVKKKKKQEYKGWQRSSTFFFFLFIVNENSFKAVLIIFRIFFGAVWGLVLDFDFSRPFLVFASFCCSGIALVHQQKSLGIRNREIQSGPFGPQA
jgi:hypothetical protein